MASVNCRSLSVFLSVLLKIDSIIKRLVSFKQSLFLYSTLDILTRSKPGADLGCIIVYYKLTHPLISLVPRLPRPMGKDGLEQLLQILGPGIKCLFHLKRTFVVKNVLFEWKRRLTLGPRI